MTSASAACGSSISPAPKPPSAIRGMNNFQIQFTRSQHVLPMTRNYMIAEEDRLRAIDSKSPRLKSVPAQ